MTAGETNQESMPARLPPGSARTFSCPSCGGSVGIRALGTSITAACQSCGSLIDVANENYRIIQRFGQEVRQSQIPLGSRAVLFGVEWEAIGYSIRCDESGMYSWREYLLFNPYQGFRFLVEADGHWNFVTTLHQSIEGGGITDNLWFEDREYRIFVRGHAKVEYVMGEFYWRVKVGESAYVADYICPPYMLSMEKSDGDVVWSHAVYVPMEEIADAFQVIGLRKPQGVAPNQPSPYTGKVRRLKWIAAGFAVALFVIQLESSARSSNQLIYDRTVQALPIYKGQLLIADPIEIPEGTRNVEVWAQSQVQNNWVELAVSLANDTSQESDDVVLPIEYYYGSDSDGSWTEGSQSNSTIIPSVPGGRYRLLVEPDAGAFTQNMPVNMQIRLKRDVPTWSNFWLALIILLTYPMLVIIRHGRFETARWQNSDYAPEIHGTSTDSHNESTEAGVAKLGAWGTIIFWGVVILLGIIFG